MSIVVRLLVLLTYLSSCHFSIAAEINRSDSEHCAFELNGEITSGDYLRFARLIDQNHLDRLNTRTESLCLNSLGGAFNEAIKIGELLYARGISTVITDGSECYSACAFIFMAGTMNNRILPYRRLSGGGILAFHAPFFRLPNNARYDKAKVEQLSQDMREAILTLIRMAARQTKLSANDFIRLSLVARILETGPTDLFYVRTIGDATRWGIEIYDAADKFPKPDATEEVKNLCNNFHDANMDTSPVARKLVIDVERYASRFNSDDSRILIRDASTNDIVCEIYPRAWKQRPDVHFRLCSYDYWSSKSFGDCREYKETLLFGKPVSDDFRFAPDTLLKRIP